MRSRLLRAGNDGESANGGPYLLRPVLAWMGIRGGRGRGCIGGPHLHLVCSPYALQLRWCLLSMLPSSCVLHGLMRMWATGDYGSVTAGAPLGWPLTLRLLLSGPLLARCGGRFGMRSLLCGDGLKPPQTMRPGRSLCGHVRVSICGPSISGGVKKPRRYR
jgi:hypothetical protein